MPYETYDEQRLKQARDLMIQMGWETDDIDEEIARRKSQRQLRTALPDLTKSRIDEVKAKSLKTVREAGDETVVGSRAHLAGSERIRAETGAKETDRRIVKDKDSLDLQRDVLELRAQKLHLDQQWRTAQLDETKRKLVSQQKTQLYDRALRSLMAKESRLQDVIETKQRTLRVMTEKPTDADVRKEYNNLNSEESSLRQQIDDATKLRQEFEDEFYRGGLMPTTQPAAKRPQTGPTLEEQISGLNPAMAPPSPPASQTSASRLAPASQPAALPAMTQRRLKAEAAKAKNGDRAAQLRIQKLREKAAEGDPDAVAALQLIGG